MCWLRKVARAQRDRSSSSARSSSPTKQPRQRQRGGGGGDRRPARRGDVVTIDFSLTPEDGFVPHPLFDTSGRAVSFVLGWGNYLPGLHDLVEGMRPGDSVTGASLDAGWGRRNPDLVAEVPKAKLGPDRALKVGDELGLGPGGTVRASVAAETEAAFVVDANHPLAGSSYACDLRVLDVRAPPETLLCDGGGDDDEPALLETSDEEEDDDEPKNSDDGTARALEPSPRTRGGGAGGPEPTGCPFRVASFAVGCFWGGELAFLREPGVAGTRVGYTGGTLPRPTYSQVCEGGTGHREAVLVLYDPTVVSYGRLVEVALGRMEINATTSADAAGLADMFADPAEKESSQYEHGIYWYSEEQRREARRILEKKGGDHGDVEIAPASTFYLAEDHHQNYLLKGGQSARKGSKEPIRCYG